MINLRKALRFGSGRGGWQTLLRALTRRRTGDAGQRRTHLRETLDFGSNPGNLRMFGYRPSNLADSPALVVVLHGCTQSAAGYDLGAGWSTLADRYGFARLGTDDTSANGNSTRGTTNDNDTKTKLGTDDTSAAGDSTGGTTNDNDTRTRTGTA